MTQSIASTPHKKRSVRAASLCGAVVLALCGVIYAAIASDKGGWVPTNFDEYNGLFWGVFLYAFTLPTACLAWRLDRSAEQDS